ncbi:MAG TPA: AraC family transcriptional regulator [Chryseosolibacter sp.]
MVKSVKASGEARIVSHLFKSDFYEIKNWTLNGDCSTSFETEYNDCFCAVHVNRGTLTKNMYALDSGRVTLEVPHFEYQLLPSTGSCTIINFTDQFYSAAREEFGIDKNFNRHGKRLIAVNAPASPEAEFVLRQLLSELANGRGSMQTDGLIMDFFTELVQTTWTSGTTSHFHRSTNTHHQDAIENAKEFLQSNFTRAISLADLSRHCGVSLFYLSRLFKQYTTYSPHQYLSSIRLKHGQMLLKDTALSVVDVSYASGFTSPEYFSTLFRLKYGLPPGTYRKERWKSFH